MRRLLVLLSGLALLLAVLPVAAASDEGESASFRWVINYRSGIPANAAAVVEASGGELVRVLPQVGIAIAVSGDESFASTMQRFRTVHSIGEVPVMALPNVTVIEADLSPAAVPDPPAAFWDLLWGIARVNAPAAWEAGITGSHDTVVAIIDTGIASNHPDVGPNIVFDGCFTTAGDHTTGDCLPYPSLSFHGTHVAGTVAANFDGGVVGVGPNLGLANYNVFELMDGAVLASFDSVWAAMVDAADSGFDVINMSLGALGQFKERGDVAFFVATKRVTDYVRQQGTVIVASAGNAAVNLNDGETLFNLPGGVPGIVNVGATGIRPDPVYPQPDASDVLAFYSNYGASVGLVAPGGDCGLDDSCDATTRPPNWFEYLVLSAFVDPNPACAETKDCPVGWAFAGGTSMAAPHVSGVAGLVRDANPGLSPQQIESILKQTAQGLGDRLLFGHGMVDAYAAATRR